ncbi:hypothetical protein [Nocardioides albus]|uniref:Uncharacterized protein n=1 Tax=Nocardioides albus TaxID=1841 RepID=A0A7W5F995_9ACTN|nr:hypothetical protein [Nocardioides albus]MBB3090084.1 hypothetical protein [Nocardioides albus]GGU27598.1 hypothetical protein GCM10007979_27920 [Nocardioides albus]
MRARMGVLEDRLDNLTRSRDALARYIDQAARVSEETYGPFGSINSEPSPA